MTSNAPDTFYTELLDSYRQTFDTFVGPCDVFVCGEMLQVNDYSKLDWEWSMFDPVKKHERRERVFPTERKKSFDMGFALAQKDAG